MKGRRITRVGGRVHRCTELKDGTMWILLLGLYESGRVIGWVAVRGPLREKK